MQFIDMRMEAVYIALCRDDDDGEAQCASARNCQQFCLVGLSKHCWVRTWTFAKRSAPVTLVSAMRKQASYGKLGQIAIRRYFLLRACNKHTMHTMSANGTQTSCQQSMW